MSWNIATSKSTSLPLTRIFDKFGDIITQQWNESQKMKVPNNPPVVWSRPHVAQDSDNSEALNSNMNSKFFYFLHFTFCLLASNLLSEVLQLPTFI
jgi:hypothetical protein